MGRTLKAAAEVAERASGPLRAVDYLRVSTEEQVKGYGITYSGKNTAKYIARKNWEHVGTFADEGVSGALEAHDRSDLDRLMSRARTVPRPFDMVVVNEGRVIGRTGRAFWRWVWELEDLGVFVAVVKRDYDNSTQDGRSRMRKDADAAEDERELIRERTQGGIQEKAEDGLYPGGNVPFGWRVAEQGKKGISHYAVDDGDKGEAATLRRAREIFLAKRSWTTVALTLNSEEKFTRSGLPWTQKNIRCRVLSDAVLNGRVVWRGDSAARRQDGSLVFGEQAVIKLPAIFTDQEIGELRSAAEARRRPPNPPGRVYILSGLLISPCGQSYRGHQHRPTELIYRCKGREETYAGAGGTCSCPPIEVTSVEKQVWSDVVTLLGDAERMQAMAQDWIGAAADEHVDHTARIAELDQRIAEQSDVIDVTTAVSARQAAKRGLRGPEAEQAVERALKPLNEELAGLEKLRSEAQAWQEEAATVAARLGDFERLAKKARNNLAGLQPEEQAELLHALELRAEVIRSAPRRKGVACRVQGWFAEQDRGVPVLDDAGWELIQPVIAGKRSGPGRRRLIVEAMLHKAATGLRWRDMPERFGNPNSLQTQAFRWIRDGRWEAAMDLLKDRESAPFWTPDPVEIKVSLRPLAIESEVGDGELAGAMEGRRSPLELTFLTAA